MRNRTGIRLDRRIELEWLDITALLVAEGASLAEIQAELFCKLDNRLSGGKTHGHACYKTVAVLSKIWAKVPWELTAFRDRAICIFPSLAPNERLALHWSMLVAGYDFFGDISSIAGRLLSLQGNFTLSQITRRMQERWGERATLSRATQRLVRSMVAWGVLVDTEERGTYQQGEKLIVVQGDLGEILLEGLLHNEERALPVDHLFRHEALFPFRIGLSLHDLHCSPRFRVHRQGMNMDVVDMARDRTAFE